MPDSEKPLDLSGLTSTQASALLKKYGPNELPSQRHKSGIKLLFDIIREPMLLLLLVSGLIYFTLGDLKDAAMLFVSVIIVISITVYQEQRSEKVLESLRQLSSPKTIVIRNGRYDQVSSREIVPGDIVVIREGDRIPGDGFLLSSTNIAVDESVLTGESLAVRKSVWNGQDEFKRPGGDDLSSIFSGTLVVQGHGLARIFTTGVHTEVGKIGKTLETIQDEDTLLQKETVSIVRTVAIIGLALCIFITVLYGITRNDWPGGVLAGITLSMSMIPEEFTVVFIIFLTFGAWRISKHQVLARNRSSIETLGAATVICVDKTGTITENKMTLTYVIPKDQELIREIPLQDSIPENYYGVLHYGLLASQRHPFDPIEKELLEKGRKYLKKTDIPGDDWKLIKEFALTKELLAMGCVWDSGGQDGSAIAVKGAPEAIVALCGCDQKTSRRIDENVKNMAKDGTRVLAVARGKVEQDTIPETITDIKLEFIGLLGFTDPVRDSVLNSVIESYRAGIRTIMITGDYPATASFVAKKIGLTNADNVITGKELAGMSEADRLRVISSVNVFARITPHEKYLIVETLKTKGEIVAMTGDGVNDAPALKTAHIGIAVGRRGTDVAREASDLVLLDDNFSSIVKAVKLGRMIYDNLKKAMAYILAVHIPIGGLALFPVLFNLPLLLFPAHIAFLELIIDPACSTIFESEPAEKDIMRRPPRNLHEPIFTPGIFALSLMQGLSVFAVTMGVYLIALYISQSEQVARTITFVSLVFANILLILVNLSWTKSIFHIFSFRNKAFWIIAPGAFLLLMLVILIPPVREIFQFAEITLSEGFFALSAGIVSLLWFELLKLFNRKLRYTK